MYYLTWNPEDKQIEATFGGKVSANEANRFSDELRNLLMMRTDEDFRVVVDLSTVNSMTKKIEASLEETREISLFGGAKKVTFVTGDTEKAQEKTAERMDKVMEGTEQYVAYQIAA